LIAIEERLLQHRKRRVRQSSRTIFAIYNSFKWIYTYNYFDICCLLVWHKYLCYMYKIYIFKL